MVSNVTVSQRAGTKLVDIYYDVSDADGDLQQVQMQASGDGGLTFTIPCTSLSGDLVNVAPSAHKHIVWNAAVDWNGQYVANLKVRVTANDGTFPPPPPGMAYIPAGLFQMGDNFNEIGTDTLPVHNVQVDGFFMDRTEVSKETWQAVQTWSTANGYSISGGSFAAAGHPVQSITWYDCVKWCNARSEKEGLTPCYYTDAALTLVFRTGTVNIDNTMVNWAASGYRLPTEAEWEKAARGSALGYRYPWGDTITGSQANYSGSGDAFEGQSTATTPVGYYNGGQLPAGVDMANGYGLYDMAGNVYEWCWDLYGSTYYGDVTANSNPHGPTTGTARVLRGGAWDFTSSYLRCAFRKLDSPYYPYSSPYGIRCVRGH
jgi:formylglycine-generating enzyme required for sulfatase activity